MLLQEGGHQPHRQRFMDDEVHTKKGLALVKTHRDGLCDWGRLT